MLQTITEEVATQVGRGGAPTWVVISTAVNSARLIVVNHFEAAQVIIGETLVGRLLGLAAELLSRPEFRGDPRVFHLFAGLYRYVDVPCRSGRLFRRFATHIYSCSSYVPIFVLSIKKPFLRTCQAGTIYFIPPRNFTSIVFV